jgi:dihydropteroate synthase-like protein
MKILLVTGQLAQDTVKNYATQSSHETETVALKIAVAAFLTPKRITEELKNRDLSGFDLIVVPGLVRGDTKFIVKQTGIAAVKGQDTLRPFNILDMDRRSQLSTTILHGLLHEKLVEKAFLIFQKTELQREELLKKPVECNRRRTVGPEFPMRVLAEIVDAAQMDKETIQATAKRFVSAGADFIDVGMVAGESQPEKASEIVRWVKQAVDVPVSIDTLDPAEIKAAIQAGRSWCSVETQVTLKKLHHTPKMRPSSLFQLISAKATSQRKPKTASNTSKKSSPKPNSWA